MFRNFINSLRRYTMASTLNIIGLSVAFAAFLVIIMQVHYELSFDKFHSKVDRIYKVEVLYPEQGVAVVSRALVNTFGESSPQIESYSILGLSWGKTYFTVERDDSKVGFLEGIETVYPSIADVFDFTMVEGTVASLEEPNKVILPRSKAQLFFGDKSAMGKKLQIDPEKFMEVGGVYEDFPANSQLNNSIYRKIGDRDGRNSEGVDNWGQSNYFMYVVLTPGADIEKLAADYAKSINLDEKMGKGVQVVLTPISDLYFAERDFVIEYLIKHGDRTTTNVMIAIALLILTIAAINFVNFSTSLAPLRMKSINIQKVLGSLNGKLRWTLIAESVGLCIISFGISLIIVYTLGQSSFRDITLSGISLDGNWSLVALTAVVALILGLLAGVYPAFYTTKFPPVMVIKGCFAMSPRGRALRTTLIGFQFVISMTLITAALFLQVQNNYMRTMDTGLPKENIAIVELGGELVSSKTFDSELKKSPLIDDVAHSQFSIGGGNSCQGWGRSLRGESIMFDTYLVSWNFPQMMGLKMAEGNSFKESDTQKEWKTYIFNETASKQYRIALSDQMDESGDIVGIVKDFNPKSLHYRISPMALVLDNNSWLPFSYIKITGNPYEAVDYIQRTAAAIDPAYPLNIQFYDQTFNNLYQKEQKSIGLITLFSILAVIISLVGVFGLVVFETGYRRKEIGLRKIHGATVASILTMFNRKFVWLVGVCFVIAAPIAWYSVGEWLKSFEYRTPMHWWVFAASLLIVLTITIITVTVQSWRAATENPVKSLKSE